MLEQSCCVCGEPLDSDNMSHCHICGGYFHMAWSTEAQVKECGQYGMYENCCGLVFVCNHCGENLSAKEGM